MNKEFEYYTYIERLLKKQDGTATTLPEAITCKGICVDDICYNPDVLKSIEKVSIDEETQKPVKWQDFINELKPTIYYFIYPFQVGFYSLFLQNELDKSSKLAIPEQYGGIDKALKENGIYPTIRADIEIKSYGLNEQKKYTTTPPLTAEQKELIISIVGSGNISDIKAFFEINLPQKDFSNADWAEILYCLRQMQQKAAQSTNAAQTDPEHSPSDGKPQDLITLSVALQRFSVSKATLLRAINNEKKITSYRLPQAAKNAPHLLSEKELSQHYLKR